MKDDRRTKQRLIEELESLRERRILLDYVHIERNEIKETGECNLEGLFIRHEVQP